MDYNSYFTAPSWSWLAAGTPVSFYPFFRASTLTTENPKFIHHETIPSKLEIGAHVITAYRNVTAQFPPQVIKSKYEKWHRFPRTNFDGIWDRWEADGIYGLRRDENSEKNDGLILFDDPECVPNTFDCAILGAGPGIGEDRDRETVYLMSIHPTGKVGEYRRLGIGFLVLDQSSDYLQGIPPKQRIVLV